MWRYITTVAKILVLNNPLDRDGHLHCPMGYRFVPKCNRAKESHTCQFFSFFSPIFAGPRFVEIQKFATMAT